jgi:hypothetical protein
MTYRQSLACFQDETSSLLRLRSLLTKVPRVAWTMRIPRTCEEVNDLACHTLFVTHLPLTIICSKRGVLNSLITGIAMGGNVRGGGGVVILLTDRGADQ